MDANTLAQRAQNCWEYAKSVGSTLNPNFEQWFKTRARQMYMLDESEVAQVWAAALKMHS